MSASKAGDNTLVTWPRDVTVSVARKRDVRYVNDALHITLSRVGTLEEDLHLYFVFVVVCRRLDVKSHEGHPSRGSDSNVTAAMEHRFAR